MNSRERRAPLDPLEQLLRESLQERAAGSLPEPDVRDELIKRAARQEQRLARQSSNSIGGLFGESTRFGYSASPNHFISLEALFGPRTSWFSFNQLTR